MGTVLGTVLNRGNRVGLIEKVICKQRLEEGERVSDMGVPEKSILR